MKYLHYSVGRLTAWLRDYGKDKTQVWREDLEAVLKAAQLADEHLDKTADGEFVATCDKLYCPQCGGETEGHDTWCAYCWNCPNPDSGNEIPVAAELRFMHVQTDGESQLAQRAQGGLSKKALQSSLNRGTILVEAIDG